MNLEVLEARLRERLALLLDLPPDEIASSQPFSELGVDSITRLELIALVEQSIGCELAEEDLGDLDSLDRVREYLAGLHGTS